MSLPAVEFDSSDPSSPSYYKPSETALLLLDFHSAFLGMVSGAETALEAAVSMRSWAKSQGVHVIHALIDEELQPLPKYRGAKMLSGFIATIKQAGGAVEASKLLEGAENEPRFTRRPGLISALTTPDIRDHLEKNGIKSLILAGITSSNCVLRTGISATELGYVTTVVSDACVDREQELHDTVMQKLLPGRAHVTTAADFQSNYGK